MRPIYLSPLLFICLLFFPNMGSAQMDNTLQIKKNNIHFELGGNAPIFSVNYERIFFQKERIKLTGSVGIDAASSFAQTLTSGWNPVSSSGKYALYLFCPLEARALYGRETNFLEFGLGYIARISTSSGSNIENYIDYDTLINGSHFSTKPWEEVSCHQHYFNLRIGYRHQKTDKKMFWKISWVPALGHNAGYKMEP